MARKHDKRSDAAKRDSAMRAGVAREVHFEAGGTPAMWRGIHTVTKNRKAEATRKACRGRHSDQE